MQEAVHTVRWLVELVLRPLDALPAHLALALVAALTAWLMIAAVERASPQRLIRRARDRMAAAIYEMRLYLDAPRRVLAGQVRLLGWTAIYLAALIPAALALAIPLGLLYLHLEIRHGLAPVAAPTSLVVRVELAPGVNGRGVAIDTGDGAQVTGPLLLAEDEPAVYARVSVRRPGVHTITVLAGREAEDKVIVADPEAASALPERRAGLAHLWSTGAEPPLPGDAIRAIQIAHPPSESGWLGLAIPWWLYWLGLATVFALVLARRRGVAL